jgi:hypothetical protein
MTTIYNNKYDIDGEAVGNQSGYSVSMNSTGDIVAIGERFAKTDGAQTGHVSVYKQIDGIWKQLGIAIDGEATGDQSGFNVSMNSAGDIVAIGAIYARNDANLQTGHVRVHQYINGAWERLGPDIDGEADRDQSGYSVSMNSAGDIVAIGALFNNGIGGNSGHVRVYQYIVDPLNDSTKIWKQLGSDINGETADDYSGYSVSMNSAGDIVAISSTRNAGDTGKFTGHVRVWKYTDTPDGPKPKAWSRLGIDIDGDAAGTLSGWSVSMNSAGNIVAVGAARSGGLGGPGRVRVYQFINDTENPSTKPWSQLGNFIDGEVDRDISGTVSINDTGDIVAIGANLNDGGGNNSGHVRVWKLIGNTWSRLGQDIDGEAADDRSGISVSMNSEGTIVAIGATLNDGGGDDSGHTRVFYYRNNAWNQAPPGFFKVSDGTFTISDTGLFTVQ